MAKIVVRWNGEEIASLNLEEGKEYLAGRAEDVDICLPNTKSLSRHHLKFYQRDHVWVVELLARFGALLFGRQSTHVLELKESLQFSVPPFEFSFIKEDVESPAKINSSTLTPLVTHQEVMTSHNPLDSNLTSRGNSDATVVVSSHPLTPFLRITSKTSPQEDVLKLEGQFWVAGRDPSCEIILNDGRASRRHFELMRSSEGFFITDLGSANGTLLNEESLPAHEAWQLTSGDVIRVAKVTLIFEIRDLAFSSQLPAVQEQFLPAPLALDQLPASHFSWEDPHQPPRANVIKVTDSLPKSQREQFGYKKFSLSYLKTIDYKKNKIKIAMGLLLPLLMYGMFSNQNPSSIEIGHDGHKDLPTITPTFETLSSEQKRAVKDSFNLAKTMFMQGKYELCLAEIQKIHEIVPSFENSMEMRDYCKQGADLSLKQRDKERREQAKAESDQFIAQVVEDCRLKVKPSTNLSQVQECLSPAIERNPEHPLVLNLLQSIEVEKDEQDRKKQALENAKQKKINGQKILEKAKKYFVENDLTKAQIEFERYLQGKFQPSEIERKEVEKYLSEIKMKIAETVSSLLSSCQQSLEKGQFKEAYLSCEQVLKIDPHHSKAKSLSSSSLTEMHRELKSMYEDSVLEESMGNVDSAKDRWKKIMEKAVPKSEYYTKSKRNLQKYGVIVREPTGEP